MGVGSTICHLASLAGWAWRAKETDKRRENERERESIGEPSPCFCLYLTSASRQVAVAAMSPVCVTGCAQQQDTVLRSTYADNWAAIHLQHFSWFGPSRQNMMQFNTDVCTVLYSTVSIVPQYIKMLCVTLKSCTPNCALRLESVRGESGSRRVY